MGAETMQHKDGMDIAMKGPRESEMPDENGQPNQQAPIVLDTQRKLGRGPIIGGVLAALVLGVFIVGGIHARVRA